MAKGPQRVQSDEKKNASSLIEWYECDPDAVIEILDEGEYNAEILETKSSVLNILPIQYAVINNDYAFCEALIDAGADFDVLTTIEGRNLLHLAARHNASSEIRNLLIEAGVYLYSRDGYGDTPYDIASFFGMNNFLKFWDEAIPTLIAKRVRFIKQQQNLEKALLHHVSQGLEEEILQQIDLTKISEGQSVDPMSAPADYSGVVHGEVETIAAGEG